MLRNPLELMHAARVALLAAVASGGCVTAPPATESGHSTRQLAEIVEQHSEDALGLPPPTALEAGGDCTLRVAERDAFDALLELDAATVAAAVEQHAPYGLALGFNTDILLAHEEYLVNYDPTVLMPTYASYVLSALDIVTAPRETCFREDIRLDPDDRSTLADYAEDIFDRGHLVPRADMNRSRKAVINTFVLSNMMPQHDQFNRGIWGTFESLVRVWATQRGEIHVVTGPLFDADDDGQPDDPETIARVAPLGNVGIPSHFFKIVLQELPNGFIESVAVILPHTDDEVPQALPTAEELELIAAGITSIDVIEALSGYDFFPDMAPRKQRAVERFVAPGLWQ